MTSDPQDPDRPSTRREARESARRAEANALPARVTAGDEDPAVRKPSTLAEASDGPAAGLDDLFAESKEAPPKKSRKGCFVVLAILLVLAGLIAAGGVWVANTYGDRIAAVFGWDGPDDYEPGEASGEATIMIEPGQGGQAISHTLHEQGVTLKPDSFYQMLTSRESIPEFYPGVYRLQQKMTSEAALEALQDPENRMEDSVMLPEGLTVEASLDRISESMGIPREELTAATEDPSAYGVEADSLEGWLFPAMYTFEPEATAQDVIQRMVDRARQSLDSAGVPAADRHRILTIASIIQREARFEDDFYKVSRVIQNRLKPDNQETRGKLDMDSTVQYGYGEMHDGTASTSTEARNDDNPWNTYMHPGLPAGPIANPGDLAIDAAMKPADGPWMYFVTVNMDTGETKFTTTYDEHLRYVEQMQQWCGENPDSGC